VRNPEIPRRLLIGGRQPFLPTLLVLIACASIGRTGDLYPPLDPSKDEVVRSAPIPSALFPQGEVRLIRRGGAAVVQTVIVSRLLKQVVREIRRKESSLWPPGRKGHEDSERYVDTLDRAYRAVESRFRERGGHGDRRGRLLIEFVLSEEAAFVAFLDPEVLGDFGGLRITGRRILEVLPLSRLYILENMREIAIDSLGWSRREAQEALKPLLPPIFQSEEDRKGPEREGVPQ